MLHVFQERFGEFNKIVNEGSVMQVTTEQLLIGFLTTSRAQRGTQAMAFLLLESEEQQLEMCSYLSENPSATDEEIMEMAQKISKHH